MMVTHYSVEAGQVACGRNNHDLVATSNRVCVTCKSCLRSEKFTISGTLQAPSWACGKTRVAQMVVAEATRPKGSWREYWTAHIRNLHPLNRLPRGFKEPKPLINLDV